MADEEQSQDQALDAEAQAAEDAIMAFLAELGVEARLHRHPPLFTVEDSQGLRGDLPGLHIKNMFTKDKKGGLWLVTCLEDRRIKMKHLDKAVDAARMSFGKPELLWQALGVRPGAVTPLALMNDRAERKVHVVFDSALNTDALVNCHPLHNRATVAMSSAELHRFVAACGHAVQHVDFDALEAQAQAEQSE